jgi:hypothetical protein
MRQGVKHSGLAGAILVGSFLLSSCADGAGEDLDAPPPVTVRYEDRSRDLSAWSYCFGNVCADNLPPAPPPDIGNPEEVVVEFPLQGWSFRATFVPVAEKCVRAQRIQLQENGEGRFMLKPVGQANTYDVMLLGKGDGDLAVTFRWTTPRDGPSGNLRSVSQPCKDGS